MTKVVPIVLDVSGVGGAHFSTELTLANRGTTASTIQMSYFAATSLAASGSGTVMESLGPGRQLVIPDTIAYLRGKGLAIPSNSGQGGVHFVTFEGLSSADVAFAGARTTAPSAGGHAGLAYPGVRLDEGFTTLVYLFGLRENAADRSNLALVNMNAAVPITLRVTLYAGADGRSKVLPDLPLEPGQWTQIGHVLSGPGYDSGFATVELVGGPGPFYAYAIFNDNKTTDGSFVAATPLCPSVSWTSCAILFVTWRSLTPRRRRGGSMLVPKPCPLKMQKIIRPENWRRHGEAQTVSVRIPWGEPAPLASDEQTTSATRLKTSFINARPSNATK